MWKKQFKRLLRNHAKTIDVGLQQTEMKKYALHRTTDPPAEYDIRLINFSRVGSHRGGWCGKGYDGKGLGKHFVGWPHR